jgi:hypothetical protein
MKTIEDLVTEGLNTVYDELGRLYGDREDIVDLVAQAAEDWVIACKVEANDEAKGNV